MSNQKGGVRVNRDEQWRLYEQMPPALRRVFAAAPFNYALPAKDIKAFRTGTIDLAGWRRHVIEKMCADIMRAARRDYGPDHPDAEISRLERRA